LKFSGRWTSKRDMRRAKLEEQYETQEGTVRIQIIVVVERGRSDPDNTSAGTGADAVSRENAVSGSSFRNAIPESR